MRTYGLCVFFFSSASCAKFMCVRTRSQSVHLRPQFHMKNKKKKKKTNRVDVRSTPIAGRIRVNISYRRVYAIPIFVIEKVYTTHTWIRDICIRVYIDRVEGYVYR